MDVEAGVRGQPPLDDVSLGGCVVVADDVYVQIGGDLFVDFDEEFAVLGGTVAAVESADDFPGGHVEGGEEAGDAVSGVVVGAFLGHAGHHRQGGLGPGGGPGLGTVGGLRAE